MPVMSDDLRIAMVKGSTANKNNKGLIGKPWHVDLLRLKGFEI